MKLLSRKPEKHAAYMTALDQALGYSSRQEAFENYVRAIDKGSEPLEKAGIVLSKEWRNKDIQRCDQLVAEVEALVATIESGIQCFQGLLDGSRALLDDDKAFHVVTGHPQRAVLISLPKFGQRTLTKLKGVAGA